MIALIPARSGSKRIPGKAMKRLGDKPLIEWTIQAAIDSECFEKVVVTVDSKDICDLLAEKYPEIITIDRPGYFAQDTSPDIEWLKHTKWYLQDTFGDECIGADFAILRPTSPFRSYQHIIDAAEIWEELRGQNDSLRSVAKVKEHPGKMWLVYGNNLRRYCNKNKDSLTRDEFHHCDLPTQQLEPVYIQNGAIYIGKWENVDAGFIAGVNVVGFVMEGDAALDINTFGDWIEAELIANGGE